MHAIFGQRSHREHTYLALRGHHCCCRGRHVQGTILSSFISWHVQKARRVKARQGTSRMAEERAELCVELSSHPFTISPIDPLTQSFIDPVTYYLSIVQGIHMEESHDAKTRRRKEKKNIADRADQEIQDQPGPGTPEFEADPLQDAT